MKDTVKILFFVLLSSNVFGQLPAEEPVEYLYKKQFYLGPKLATTGFGFRLGGGFNTNFKTNWGLDVSLNQLKSDKEFRKKNSLYEDSKSYVFGKINSSVTTHIAIQYRRMIFEKRRIRGVTIHFISSVGVSFSWTKPVYLKIREPNIDTKNIEPRDERYDPAIHFEENIYGRSSFFKGFQDGVCYAGIYGKAGFLFDVSKNPNKLIGVELGLQFDKFQKTLPLFYTGQNKNFFPGLYASLIIGINQL